MPDDFIRRMIRAAIETFPIDEAKKADILRSIVGKKENEGDPMPSTFTDNSENGIV